MITEDWQDPATDGCKVQCLTAPNWGSEDVRFECQPDPGHHNAVFRGFPQSFLVTYVIVPEVGYIPWDTAVSSFLLRYLTSAIY
jgi:hypothetical protein